MTAPAPPPRETSLTFIKGLAVLRAFDAEHAALSSADVARRAGLDRATARRLIRTLEYLGYVRRAGRLYWLTPRVLILAAGFLQANRFGLAVQPILTAAAERLGVQIVLAMRDGDAAVLVAQSAAGAYHVSLGLTLGSRLPLETTALGQVLLAGGPDAPAELAGVGEAGHAHVSGRFEPGVAGLAVPVGPPGGVQAALGISLPAARLEDEGFRTQALEALRGCARALAASLAAPG